MPINLATDATFNELPDERSLLAVIDSDGLTVEAVEQLSTNVNDPYPENILTILDERLNFAIRREQNTETILALQQEFNSFLFSFGEKIFVERFEILEDIDEIETNLIPATHLTLVRNAYSTLVVKKFSLISFFVNSFFQRNMRKIKAYINQTEAAVTDEAFAVRKERSYQKPLLKLSLTSRIF